MCEQQILFGLYLLFFLYQMFIFQKCYSIYIVLCTIISLFAVKLILCEAD